MSLGTADEFLLQVPRKRGQMTLVPQGITGMLNWQKNIAFY